MESAFAQAIRAFQRLAAVMTQVKASGGQKELISPLPQGYVPQVATPTPTPTPRPQVQHRNPLWEQWAKVNPKAYQELLSGTQQASKKTGVPQDLLMDIAGIETSGGQFLKQMSGGPGRGFYQFEPETYKKIAWEGFNPNSATDSAQLAAQEIAKGNLSRWGTPSGKWGSINNSQNTNGKITSWYQPEEINPYLREEYQF